MEEDNFFNDNESKPEEEQQQFDLREFLLDLAEKEEIPTKPATIKKASEKTLEKIYDKYKAKQAKDTNEMICDLLIIKTSDILESIGWIKSSTQTAKKLQTKKLFMRDFSNLMAHITPYIPFLGFIEGGLSLAFYKKNRMETISFTKENFKIRVVEKDGEDLFYAIDVAKSLGCKNTDDSIRRHVHKEYIESFPVKHWGPILLKEPGLYQLIFRSKKKEAIEFQKWVFEEVLPSIRKTGRYEIKSHIQKLQEVEQSLTRQYEQFKECKSIVININNNLKDPSKVELGQKGGMATAKKHRDNESKLVSLEEKLATIVQIVNE